MGAAIGGAVLAAFGAGGLLPATAGIGLLSIVLCVVARPEARVLAAGGAHDGDAPGRR